MNMNTDRAPLPHSPRPRVSGRAQGLLGKFVAGSRPTHTHTHTPICCHAWTAGTGGGGGGWWVGGSKGGWVVHRPPSGAELFVKRSPGGGGLNGTTKTVPDSDWTSAEHRPAVG